MGPPKKRSREMDYEIIRKQLKKLKKQVKKKQSNRRRISSSSSSSSSPDNWDENTQHLDYLPSEEGIITEQVEVVSPEQENLPVVPPGDMPQPNEEQPLDVLFTENDLDQSILDILGEDPSSDKKFGENLNKNIASRWTHILLNGLNKEIRSELLKLYLPAENCPNMKAPKLNPEIKAALTELNNKKDVYSQSKQNQLASCLAAIGKALDIVLTMNTKELIKPLSDAARLLCDFHFKESLSRRYAAMNTLSKQTKDILKNTKIDNFLFGSDLAEHLKSSKAISKSGLEMRPPVAGPSGIKTKPISTTTSQTPAARRGALNARGAPRAAAAEPRANPVQRRPPAQQYRHSTSSRPSHRYRSRKH